MLGIANTSTIVGHFVSSSRIREKRDRKDSRGHEREGQGRKRNRNENEETEVQLILAYSWARPAILLAGKGRGGMVLFLLSSLSLCFISSTTILSLFSHNTPPLSCGVV